MKQKRMMDNLRLINDVQANEYDKHARVIRSDSPNVKKFHDAANKRCEDRCKRISFWACIGAPVMAVIIGGIVFWSALSISKGNLSTHGFSLIVFVSCFAIIGIAMACSYLYEYKPKGFGEALSAWYDGAYRESTWYQGLSAEEKANAIGIIESKAYSLISERMRDMQSTNYNMGPVVSMLDRAIRNDRTILDSDMADVNTRDRLRGMMALYESYRSKLGSDDRVENIPFITQGMTDLMQDDEKLLSNAVDAYNNEVNLAATNAPRISEYKAMLRTYRDALTKNPAYNDGHPTSQALSDAERFAYAGFTM